MVYTPAYSAVGPIITQMLRPYPQTWASRQVIDCPTSNLIRAAVLISNFIIVDLTTLKWSDFDCMQCPRLYQKGKTGWRKECKEGRGGRLKEAIGGESDCSAGWFIMYRAAAGIQTPFILFISSLLFSHHISFRNSLRWDLSSLSSHTPHTDTPMGHSEWKDGSPPCEFTSPVIPVNYACRGCLLGMLCGLGGTNTRTHTPTL